MPSLMGKQTVPGRLIGCWHIGRTDEIPDTGDYLTFELLEQSVVAIRQRDASVKVFANVCAHRCAKLVEDSGHSDRIVCPYHAWTYRTDGQLIAAPYMDQTPGFDSAGIWQDVWQNSFLGIASSH